MKHVHHDTGRRPDQGDQSRKSDYVQALSVRRGRSAARSQRRWFLASRQGTPDAAQEHAPVNRLPAPIGRELPVRLSMPRIEPVAHASCADPGTLWRPSGCACPERHRGVGLLHGWPNNLDVVGASFPARLRESHWRRPLGSWEPRYT